jgi:hypothetical protein
MLKSVGWVERSETHRLQSRNHDGFRCAQPILRRLRTHHRSREEKSPEACHCPSHERGKRSADRRPGAAAPVFRCGPLALSPPRPRADSSRRPRAGGRSPLGAPPRRFFGPEPALAIPSDVAYRGGVLKLRDAAFAGPARSGGRAVSLRRLPGVVGTNQPAGRRIPLRLWLVSGDALGERDVSDIGANGNAVKEKIPSTADKYSQAHPTKSPGQWPGLPQFGNAKASLSSARPPAHSSDR